ncbi:tRNA pseudouridine(55) synthase TruB [Fibrobacter sp.]|uniref:tRNA pseudouridine(55) synthase TruB n=1 Tax=Fibrobacter sp. TaxID=35828 RepID=UPI0025BC4E82|nr:tRNA pseudouridine(55) synthase TruB [Fibrobacter sp.]MBR2058668.1 tRNA pseudouridine(55) synthase TruB [Fibrobacter sp.]MBR2307461.1 tRNA pseudouridine(55) synthase TruB [Fibrobacter sp.]MBR4009048.1 tRNA pseudouridine(55) synthase TruB [Fibrobacter sp.]
MAPSGFILLDKAAGETSFKALFPLKRVFCTKRVGHAGTLDLRASGLIIAATGRATRLLPYVEAKDKCYTFRLHLGYETDTLEWDGDVVEQDESCHPGAEEENDESVILSEAQRSRRIQGGLTREDLEAILPQFTGDIDQVPPRYCAVKIDGRRASDWAERGKDFEMKPRRIHIESLKVVGEGGLTEGCSGKEFATFDIECVCSKGTYVRALGRDIARALGTCGCVSQIRRHRIGKVSVESAVRGEDLTREHLKSVEQVLDFPVVKLDAEQMAVIRKGNWIPWREPVEGAEKQQGRGDDCERLVFAADASGNVLSVCRYEPGRICPKIYLGEDE